MSRSFNLTAELNLRGPSNIRPIIADIRRQLTGITANVNVTVNNTTTRNVNNLQQSVTRLNAALTATRGTATNATAALNAFARAAANVNNNIGNIPRNLTRINTGAGATTTTLNQVTRATQQATVGFEDFGRQSALAVRRFAAFATVTSVIYRFTNAITSATSEFIDFNRELVRVAQVTDSSLSELRPLVSQITNLSTSLGIASQDLIQVSSTLAQAGLSARDTEKALKALALSALAPSFDSLSDTVEGSIALMRQFGISAGDLEGALGSVNAVAAKFAVEASDLITAIQRTGGVFATASKGVTEGKDALNEFLAVFTSVRATTRESAETIATGLRTIFTRIQRADTIKALKEFGVTLTDLQGKFVGPYEAVRRLSEGLSRLDPRDLRFSQIVEELGGFRQIGKVIPLIQQFATAQAALKVAQQGQGSLAKDASTAQQSLANQIAKVREEFTALIRSLGESSTFQTFVRLSLDLASALIRLADSAKTVLPALTAIAAFRGVSALTRFGAGFASGLRRQNNGGPVRGFASGGLVPGQGNSDTVPAMLTAGEFVIRKKAVQRIGVANLHKINRRAAGGKIKDLLPDKPLLRNKYDTSDIEDLYSLIRIDRSKQNKLSQSREQYREKAEKIWSQASSAFATKGSLSGANTLIRRKTGINLPSKLSSKELTPGNKDKQRLNKIQGSLAEKEAYDRMGNLRQLPIQAGADFAVGGSPFNFVEVKNRLEPTSDNDLRGKALLGHQYLSGKQYLNNKLDKTPRLTISLLSSNPQDYKKKNLGGLIQKFTRGGKGKALGARSRFKELDASELDKLSTADLIKYAKRQARDVFSTGGAGMAMRSRFIETPANKITPELEPHLTSYMGKKGFWREEIAPFGRPSKQQAAKASKTGREEALKKQEARQADEVAARAQQWKLIRSGSKIDSYLLSSLKDPILSDYKSAKAGQPLAKAFHETRLRQAVNKTLDDFDDFDYSPAKIDKLVSGMAAKRFGRGGKASSDFTGYHGSAHIFSKIDASKLGKRGANLYGAGFNIAMDRGMAKSYAKKSGAVYPVTVKGGISDFIEANSLLSENPKALQSIQKIFKQQKIPVKGLEQLTFKDASNKLTETLLERIEKKLPKKPGVDANSRFMEAFGIASQKVRQLMVVGGIPGTKVTINRPLDEQMAVAYDLDRLELGKPLKSKRFARGGSVEDKVPALLTPGEFVINKKAAGRIGASRLHQLNRADRIQGFNKGGAVGGIQKLAGGGFLDPQLDNEARKIALELKKGGMDLASALEEARKRVREGMQGPAPASSSSQKATTNFLPTANGLSDSQRRVQVTRSSEDIQRQRLERRAASRGADITKTSDMMTSAGALNTPSDPNRTTVSGATVGKILNQQQNQNSLLALSQGRSAAAASYANLAQSSSQKTYAASSFDPTQLYQALGGLNKGLATAASSLTSLSSASKSAGGGLMSLGKGALGAVGRGAGGLISKIGGGVLGAVGLGGLSSRGGAGGAGGAEGGGMGGMMGMALTMAGGVGIDMLSKSMGGEKTEAGRTTSSVLSGALNMGSTGAMLGSMFGPMGTAIGAAAGGLIGLAMGFADAQRANEEYAQSQREATAATASDKSGKALQGYMAKPGAAQKQAFMSAFSATSEAEAAVGAGVKRQTVSSFGKMLGYQDESITDLAARKAKTQTAGADQAQQFLANEMMRTGKSFGEVSKTMSPDQFKTLAANIAEADETYAYFQIQRANEIKKLRDSGRGAEADALQAETNTEQANLAKNIAERKLAEASAAAQAKAAAEASKKLNMVMMQAVMGLEKSFNTMEEVLNRSSFELGQISGKADEIFSGKASLTSSTFAQTNNVLQNPNAYSAAERQNAINSSASRMGPAGALVGRVATFGAQATEEASRRANAVFNAGGTNEEVGGEVTRSLTNNILATFGPNSSMSQTLIDGVKRSVDEAVKTAKENGETLDPNELIEKATGPLNKAAQQAGQLLIKNNENVAKHLEELGKVAERVVEIENRRADRTAALVEMQAQGGISAKEALGQKVSLDERIGARFAGSRARLGIQGQANFTPQNIANMRSQAQREQAALQSQIDRKSASVGSDPTGRAAREVGNLQLKLAKVNSTIEQTNKELESLPGALEGAISDVTSEIQNRVAKLDAQKQAAGAFAEKLVGSTPQELMELSRTFDLLNNTLRGQVTTIQQSQVAQQAYIQSIQEGKTAQEAMADAQTAFANENKKALSLFGELTQIAGIEGPELDLMKADLLENFAKAQGAGLENNPFFQTLLKKLRESPEDRAKNDPVLKALQQKMTELREQQVEAVKLQNEADRNIQQQLLKDVGDNIIKSLKETQTAFVNAMNDIAMRMGAMPARPRSTGGLIYASNGQFVNFEPKGTDTVPAMLTPGEFVVNAKSTKENLGLLMAINNSRGGRISYLADGGMPDISGVSSRTQSAKQEDMARSGLINQRSLSNKIDTVKSLSNNINSTTSFTKDNQIPSLDGSIDNNQSANNKQFKSLLVGVNKISSVIEKSMGSQGLSRGGVVYANSGGYIGNGTPAMLSPGEFVVNQASTKRYGGILQAINREDGGGTPFNAPVLDMTGGQQNKNGVFVRSRYRGPRDTFMSAREAAAAGIPYSTGTGSNTTYFGRNTGITKADFDALTKKDEKDFSIFNHPTLVSQGRQAAFTGGFIEGVPVGAASAAAGTAAAIGTGVGATALGVTAPVWLPAALAITAAIGAGYAMSKLVRATSNKALAAGGSNVTMDMMQEDYPLSFMAGSTLGDTIGGVGGSKLGPQPFSGILSKQQSRLSKLNRIQKRQEVRAAISEFRERVVARWDDMSELEAAAISRMSSRKAENLFAEKLTGQEIIDSATARLKLLNPKTNPDDYLPIHLDTRLAKDPFGDGTVGWHRRSGRKNMPEIVTTDPQDLAVLPHEAIHAMIGENPQIRDLTRDFIVKHEDLIQEWLSKTKMTGYNLDTMKHGASYRMMQLERDIRYRDIPSAAETEKLFAKALSGGKETASLDFIQDTKSGLEYVDRLLKQQSSRGLFTDESEIIQWVNKKWDRSSLDSLKKTIDDFRNKDTKLYEDIMAHMGTGGYPGVGAKRLPKDLLESLNEIFSSQAARVGPEEFLTTLAQDDLTGNAAGQQLQKLVQKEIFEKANEIKYKFLGFPEQPTVGAEGFNNGGVVYASEGRYINFKPKGTDTVPAMLTPGEFVVNAKATKDNLSTLQAINAGYYETGGIAGVDPSPSNFARGIVASRMARIQNLPDKWVIASGGGYFINKPGKRDEQTGKFLDPETDFNNQPFRNGPVVYDINQAAYVTGATSVREASQLLKEKYPWWRPGRGRIVEAKKLYRSGVKQNNLQQNIIDELFDQMREAPYLFGRTAFYLGEPGPKFAAISQKITEGRMNVAEGYRKATKRQNYLRHVMNNTNLAYRILSEEYLKKEIPGQPPPGVAQTTVKDVLSFQNQSAEKEIRIISQVWDSLISGNRMVNGRNTRNAAPAVNVPRDATTSFNALDPSSLPRGGDGDGSYFDKGGIVYANRGTLVPYEPRGTDTVPAMLTPGEFVVNRQASQKHLGLLQSINNGNYSRGGTVYLAEGTPGTQAFDANMTYLSDILKKGADTLNTAFIEAVRKLNNIADNSPQIRQDTSNGVSNNQSNPLANIQALGNRLDQFIEQLKNAVPSTVTLEVPSAIPVNVTINGASILRDLLGGPLGNIVQKAIKDAFDAKSRENEGY